MGPPGPPSLHAGNARWSCWRGSTRSEGPPNYHEVKLGRVPANRCPASFLRIIGSSPFTFAAQAGQALHVLDRFHITSHLNQAVDQVRRAESTRLRAQSKAAAQRVKHMRWPLLRRGRRVRGRAREKLNALLASKLSTARAWDLKETFSYFWHYRSPIWAGAFLDYWC